MKKIYIYQINIWFFRMYCNRKNKNILDVLNNNIQPMKAIPQVLEIKTL